MLNTSITRGLYQIQAITPIKSPKYEGNYLLPCPNVWRERERERDIPTPALSNPFPKSLYNPYMKLISNPYMKLIGVCLLIPYPVCLLIPYPVCLLIPYPVCLLIPLNQSETILGTMLKTLI